METDDQKINTTVSADASPEPALQISGYKIMRELGHGGMAHVYLAVQESFGREVALKILSPHLTDDDQFSQRFLREARIVSQLNHPNIVTVYDAGKQGKYHYMSMEYIPGKDLKQLKDSVSRNEALRIVKSIAAALDFAGSKGIVHRDVKPENVMIHETDNRVILMDFGIAHGDDVTHGMTQTGKAIGTPHYMSPEQTKGLKVDHRSDIYSLGIVLFQLLAGYLPYEADSAVAVGIKHLTAPIPLLPAGLEIFQPIINRCLSKEPQHRYQKAAELIEALNAISNEQLQAIDTRAKLFKQAGADHDAATQMSDAPLPVENKRKIPELVFPNPKSVAKEPDEDTKPKSHPLRNLFVLLLISGAAWAGYEKQHEIEQFWGYKALPKLVEVFPNMFSESYLKYWADKAKKDQPVEQNNEVVAQATPTETITTPAPVVTEENTIQPEQPVAVEEAPVEKVLTRDERIELLKTALDNQPENAIQLAGIYKEMLVEMPRSPVAHQGIKELREWLTHQIKLSLDTQDSVASRKYVDIVKQSFPRIAATKRFTRLENKVVFLERIDNHLSQADKYFSAGAISKPIGKNALYEIQKILILDPENKEAKNFINKIALSYIDKTTQLQQQGNMQNALLMIEEGIAAMNNHPALLEKRESLQNQIKNKKTIASLFTLAKKYLAEGQLIKPIAYNAYDQYNEILKKDPDNLEAQAGIKNIHQLVTKDIAALVQKGQLKASEEYLALAMKRYGRTSLLASVELKLNDALAKIAPKIQNIILSNEPVTHVPAIAKRTTANTSLKNTQRLSLMNILYAGINFINFDPGTTWLEATLIDSTRETKILQKPIVVSNQFGEHYFEIKLPSERLQNSLYTFELKLKNKVLISESFLILN